VTERQNHNVTLTMYALHQTHVLTAAFYMYMYAAALLASQHSQ